METLLKILAELRPDVDFEENKESAQMKLFPKTLTL